MFSPNRRLCTGLFCANSLRKMSQIKPNALLPVDVRGMKVLDRDKFLRNIQVPVLIVPEKTISNVLQLCKKYFLKLQNFAPVQKFKGDSDNGQHQDRILHLNPEQIEKWTDFSEAERTKFNENNVTEDNFNTRNVELRYENWGYDQIFKAVLPADCATVSGFSHIGHIVHLNLRDHLLDYRHLIGQVLIDKIKTCKTVINKSNIIDNTYRNFSLELLAGIENYEVSVRENNCSFNFDFSKVYWNPRLGKEHERIIKMLNSGDILFDVFCGVGPFAIPAAKKTCFVYANDLNPESYNWLNYNTKLNKIKPEYFTSYNLDGKDFICLHFKQLLEDCFTEKLVVLKSSKIHVTMNLPAIAVEFLKYFNGLLETSMHVTTTQEIIVHVYCFVPSKQPEIAIELVARNIGSNISQNIVDVLHVRNVAPSKEMMRVSFKLPLSILKGNNTCVKRSVQSHDIQCKKLCVESVT